MNIQDKDLLKQTALVTADTIVATFDAELQARTKTPLAPFTFCWNLSKAVYGNVMKLRQERTLNFVNIVQDNPAIFTEEILSDEKFQDGFVYSLEKYLIERSDEKRRILKNIFLGFAQARDKNNFPLEKFTHTLSQLSELDISVFSEVDINNDGKNYQIYPVNNDKTENVFNLIREGLLIDTTGNRMGYPQDSPFVKASFFGKEFIKYLTNEN